MKQHQLLPKNAVVINGYCQDIHAGSFIEPIKNFSLQKVINYKYDIQLNTYDYENSWNGYQEWLVKNRLSKFIINSVRVFEYFGIDFYLPFWNRDWIDFCYSRSQHGKLVSDIHTDLYGDTDLIFTKEINSNIDVLFLCLPHGETKPFLENNSFSPTTKIIDLSNDFRLKKDAND